jgi:CheY-like chemotaxis protein
LRVLVVDDDPQVRALFVEVLRQAGANVESSGLAEEAVKFFDAGTPDVVVTDLRMPVHDGVWLLREAHRRAPAVPVIAISGHVKDFDVRRLRSEGFADVLAKPLPLDELTNSVARVAARRP